jgi:hypothetical protein
MERIKAKKSHRIKSNLKAYARSDEGLHAEKTEGKARKVHTMSLKDHRTKTGSKSVFQALRKEHHPGKGKQAKYQDLENEAGARLQGAEMTSSQSSEDSQYHKFKFNDLYEKDSQQSKHRTREHGTRELVLPSDSNVVKGNV